jgi:hypothetical protein
MREAFILRCSFETVFGGICARGGYTVDVGAAGDQVDHLIPFSGSRKGSKANVAHHFPLDRRGSTTAYLV